MSVVETFHDGFSVESEVEESLGREQLLRVSAVADGAALRPICEKKSLLTWLVKVVI